MKDFKFFQKETPKGLYATINEQIIEQRRLSRGYSRGEIFGGIDVARYGNATITLYVGTGTGGYELLNRNLNNERL